MMMSRYTHYVNDFLRPLITLLSIVCLASASAETLTVNGYQYSVEEKGNWVNQLPIIEGNKTEGENVQYLLSDEQLNLSKGQHLSYYRLVQKVVTNGGMDTASNLRYRFAPDYQTLTIHHINIIRDGKVIDALESADIQLMRRETNFSSNLYSGMVDFVALLSDVRVGDTVDYALTVDGKNPVFGDKNFNSFSLGYTVPLALNHVRVISDIDRPLVTRLHLSDVNIETEKTAEQVIYTIKETHLTAIVDEQNYPADANPFPYVEFSEFDTWQSVVDWALPLYILDDSDDALVTFVETLKSNTNSTRAYIEEAIRFVQSDVRYFGIEIGVNSHKPSKPSEVYERRYGDCKDKTMLLNYLLSAVGVKAVPALVSINNGGAIPQHLPSPGSFNHVVSHFVFDGQAYWVDGTRGHQYGNLAAVGVGDFKHALLIRDGETTLTDVNYNPKQLPTMIIGQHFSAAKGYDQPVTYDVKIVATNREAESLRSSIAGQPWSQFSKNYLNYFARQFPSIKELTPLAVDDDKHSNTLTLTAQYEITEYWDLSKESLETNFFADFMNGYTAMPTTVDRKLPLQRFTPEKIKQTITFEYPEVIAWELDYEPLTIEDEALRYQRQIHNLGATMKVEHEFETKASQIPADAVPEHVKHLKEMKDSIYLVLTAPNNNTKLSGVKNRLRALLKARQGG